jgi:hypothetical protein
MNTVTFTQHGNGESLNFHSAAGHIITSVRVNGEPVAWTLLPPCTAALTEAPPLGSVVKIEASVETNASDVARLEETLREMYAIKPSDTEDLKVLPRAIFVTGKGTIAGITLGGEEMTLAVRADQLLLRIMFKRIKKTGTTATGLVAVV